MRVFSGIGQFAAAVGTELGTSDWYPITQTTIDSFAAVTGDDQWIHVDTARAARGQYGATIAHGYLTISTLPILMWQIYRIEGVAQVINYGSNRIRFPAPVRVGDSIRARARLLGLEPRAGGVVARVSTTVNVDSSTKPVCVAETLSLIVAHAGSAS